MSFELPQLTDISQEERDFQGFGNDGDTTTFEPLAASTHNESSMNRIITATNKRKSNNLPTPSTKRSKHVIDDDTFPRDPKKPLQCRICGRNYKLKHHFEKHIKTHTENVADNLSQLEIAALDFGPIEESVTYPHTQIPYEPPICLSVIEEDPHGNAPITYKFHERGSQKGTDSVVGSDGFAHTREGKPHPKTGDERWKCTVRTKTFKCPGKIFWRQKIGAYVFRHEHTCGKDRLNEGLYRDFVRDAKELAAKDPFVSSQQQANYMIDKCGITKNGKFESYLGPKQIAARLAYAKRNLLPKEPAKTELFFILDTAFIQSNEHIPDEFLRFDLILEDARHIILSSNLMWKYLILSNEWYIDATFKVTTLPFCQLFSIHVFLNVGLDIKQFPVCYVLMSRRRKTDYAAIFQKIIDLVAEEGKDLNVYNIIADFEAAEWVAIKNVFADRDIKVKGCMFHFSQALYRKIKSIGLVDHYKKDNEGHGRLLKSLMALPLLPKNHIVPAFENLTSTIKPDNVKMYEMVQYFNKTWIQGTLFTPDSWCWFDKPIRTNNDLEGYHNKLNKKADGKSFNVYKLLQLLGRDAKDVSRDAVLLQQGDLKRHQKKTTIRNHKQLQKLWDEYKVDPITYNYKWLLDRGSRCMKPSAVWDYTPEMELEDD